MLAEIAEAVETTLKSAGLRFALVEVHGADPDREMPSPAALIYVDSGEFEKLASESYKVFADITVALVFKDLGREKARRAGVAALIEGVVDALALQSLGIPIAPIKPQGFRNVTDKDLAELGLVVFAVRFKTSFTWTKPDPDADALDLLRIGLNYFLQDPADDAVADAADLTGEPYPVYSPVFSFTGAGLNDFNLYGSYSGPEITGDIVITITAGDPDTAVVAVGDNDPVALEITGAEQALPGVAGVTFSFDAVTGHTEGDAWTILLNA